MTDAPKKPRVFLMEDTEIQREIDAMRPHSARHTPEEQKRYSQLWNEKESREHSGHWTLGRRSVQRTMRKGLRGMASRSVQAEERFIEYAMKHGRLSRAQAQRALTTFRKARVIKLDAVTGQFSVKHGAFLEPDVLQRAAEA